MTDEAASFPPTEVASGLVRLAPSLFGTAVFTSAALIFLVEPMIARLVLPTLGGSPAVWNTCMVFFQAALLVGYGYAHLLQRIRSLKVQAGIHAVVLLLAALTLPLEVSERLGPPSSDYPIAWLLGVLALSIGAPFASLCATAPLVQAWYARIRAGRPDAANPYVLYAASNLGSLIALLAYPTIVEPTLRLKAQTASWTFGYAIFFLLMALVALSAARAGPIDSPVLTPSKTEAPPLTWKDRLIWLGLAAVPSSLMLGVTSHITTDIASAPFLWVAPLALYLLTFIIAFAAKPLIPASATLAIQAVALTVAVAALGLSSRLLMLQIAIQMAAFFFTALICHQALAARRPHPARLTEFFLLLSLGGVIGGLFNAIVAPSLFNGVWEYPLVLALSCLARPWGRRRIKAPDIALVVMGLTSGLGSILVGALIDHGKIPVSGGPLHFLVVQAPTLIFAAAPICAFLLRRRALLYGLVIAVTAVASLNLRGYEVVLSQTRSFFGVLKITHTSAPPYAYNVRMLAHGTTMHGAQALDAADPCRPLTYYGPGTPIGQVFHATAARKPHMVTAAVGMGAGTVAAYARPGDALRFYEIDPKVIAIATDIDKFTYISGCAAKAHVDWVLGDARLSLQKEKPGIFDVILVDAFTSDAVPAHLLTVEAMRMYLQKVAPDGIVIMHLSNRNLDLERPVAAAAVLAGGASLQQFYNPPDRSDLVESPENVIIVARSEQALAPYMSDPRWRPAHSDGVRAWTDDYTNLFSALIRRMRDRDEIRKAARPSP